MPEDFGLQLSINIPSGEQYEKGHMINIRGRDAQEFHQNIIGFDEHLTEQVASLTQNILAKYQVATQLGGQTIERQQGSAQPPPQGPPQGQQTPDLPHDQQASPQNYQNQPQSGYQGNGGGNPQGNYQQPAQGQQPPQGNDGGIPTQPPPHVGPPPQCSHGTKRFLAKPYKGGKPGYWMAWACPAQRGDNTQHDLEFIRQN